jgi:hypothetical protein
MMSHFSFSLNVPVSSNASRTGLLSGRVVPRVTAALARRWTLRENLRSCLLRGALMAFCGVIFSAPNASAGLILWHLVGVTFADGGTASGSFDYNADTNTYSFVNITTAGGSQAGSTYLALDPGASSSDTILGVVPNAGLGNFTGTPLLAFQFASPLTDSGGTTSTISPSAEGTCANAACSSANGGVRFVSTGSVSSVPEPSTLGLVLLGALGLVLGTRRPTG